jgi:hypothetical protein
MHTFDETLYNQPLHGAFAGAVLLETFDGAFMDVGKNPSLHIEQIPVVETADTTRAALERGVLNLNNGTLEAHFSETMDNTPASGKVTSSKFSLVDTGGVMGAFNLNNAQVVEVDSTVVTLYMTELQRVKAIERSATPGGDGSDRPLSLQLQNGAATDMGLNLAFPTYSTGGNLAVVSCTPRGTYGSLL